MRPSAGKAVVLVLILLAGCQQKMADQPSFKPLVPCQFFGDGRSARPPVAGTVARGHLPLDAALVAGWLPAKRSEGGSVKPKPSEAKPSPARLNAAGQTFEEDRNYVDSFPFPMTRETVEHGFHRYMIYCVVCHDALGSGRGKIVERGYTAPPPYHLDRLRDSPVGRLFAVVSEGYGSMPSYSAQIPVRDRWAIVAYLRALQASQRFPVKELPARLRSEWEKQASTLPGKGRTP